MTTQCPRCATPRFGESPFCHQCGLDLRGAGGPAMPPQQALPPQQPLYGAPQQPLYGAPPQQPYGVPPSPYYYQPQSLPQQVPAYQPANQWSSPWQAPQAPVAPSPASQAPAPTPPTASDSSAEAVPATDQATPDQSSAWQPQAAPSVCLRCYAPLHPGYSHCANCGFDNSTAWSATAPATSTRVPPMAYALALLGAGLVVVAAALAFVAQQ